MTKVGEEYERAVYQFIQTLDPSAEVFFNYYVPDSVTGEMRQCDVWINAKYMGFSPLSFYISCKDHSRKQDLGDIDRFIGEMHSRRATNGIIYSKAGFTKTALQKAEKLGISCCKIYRNEPSDLPKTILFEHFALYSSIALSIVNGNVPKEFVIWNDAFSIRVGTKKVIDIIQDIFSTNEEKMLENAKANGGTFPEPWEAIIDIYTENNDYECAIKMPSWRVYMSQNKKQLC